MATKKSQRIAIWVIAGVLVVGTLASFIAMMVAPGNEAKEKAEVEAAQNEWNSQQEAQAKELNDKYLATFSQFTSRVGQFSAEGVDELGAEDLLVGDGDEIGDDTSVSMYYTGWTPDGEVFDQSIEDGELLAPLAIADGPANTGVIEGWQKGLVGMKIGGVRELTIPSDMGYGETGSSNIAPDTPLKFVVMAIPLVEEIPAPQILKDYYKRLYGIDF